MDGGRFSLRRNGNEASGQPDNDLAVACEPSRARRLVQIRERLRRELHAASDAAFDRSRDFHAAFSLGRPRAELKFAGSRRWPGKANPDKSGLRTELQALRRRRCSVPRQKVVRRRRILRRQSDDHPVGGRIPKGAQVRAELSNAAGSSLYSNNSYLLEPRLVS